MMWALSTDQDISKADWTQIEETLQGVGVSSTSLAYIRQLRQTTRMSQLTTVNNAPPQQSASSDLFGRFSAVSSRLTERFKDSGVAPNLTANLEGIMGGIKGFLPANRDLTITKIVESIVDPSTASSSAIAKTEGYLCTCCIYRGYRGVVRRANLSRPQISIPGNPTVVLAVHDLRAALRQARFQVRPLEQQPALDNGDKASVRRSSSWLVEEATTVSTNFLAPHSAFHCSRLLTRHHLQNMVTSKNGWHERAVSGPRGRLYMVARRCCRVSSSSRTNWSRLEVRCNNEMRVGDMLPKRAGRIIRKRYQKLSMFPMKCHIPCVCKCDHQMVKAE